MKSPIRFTNGVTVVYAMGLVNAVLACVVSFGVHLSETQQGTLMAVANALFILVAHAGYSHAKHSKQVIPPPPEAASTQGNP